MDTLKCSGCPDGTIFNSSLHVCQIKTDKNCSGNQIYNEKSKLCECPPGLSYFDGEICVGCFIPQFWNSKNKKCQTCPSGNYYSLKNESCVNCPKDVNSISSLSGCHDECSLSKPYFDG